MASFFAEQRAIAQQVRDEKERAQLQKAEQKKAGLQELFDRLAVMILDGWEEKVREAAKRGDSVTNIFQYTIDDRLDDKHPFVFLIVGPKHNRDCWEDGKWRSVRQQVKAVIQGAYLSHKYVGNNNFVIEVDWSVPVEP